jgi:hypothetical protein
MPAPSVNLSVEASSGLDGHTSPKLLDEFRRIVLVH